MKSAVYLRNHFFLWFEALCDSVLVIKKLQNCKRRRRVFLLDLFRTYTSWSGRDDHLSSPASLTSGNSTRFTPKKRKQNAQWIHKRDKIWHQYGHHSSSSAVCIDMCSWTKFNREMCLEVQPKVCFRVTGRDSCTPGCNRTEEKHATADTGSRIRDRSCSTGNRLSNMPRGIWGWRESKSAAKVSPWFSCEVYWHLVGFTLFLSYVSAIVVGAAALVPWWYYRYWGSKAACKWIRRSCWCIRLCWGGRLIAIYLGKHLRREIM